jgi:hypothetical protein
MAAHSVRSDGDCTPFLVLSEQSPAGYPEEGKPGGEEDVEDSLRAVPQCVCANNEDTCSELFSLSLRNEIHY